MASIWAELKRRNVVRVAIAYAVATWLILQLTDVLMSLLDLPEWIGRTVVLLLLIGFLLALFLSWVYELTPEGPIKEKDIDRSLSMTRVTGRKLDFAIIALLVVAVGYFAYDKFVLDPARDAASDKVLSVQLPKTIAVLPFVAMSSGEDDGYFADGLTEEILNVLAQLPELQVTARTSSFFFKGQNIPVPEIAERLNVAHVVEGSVRRDGEQVRITAQLIRAADGFHLWSNSYDRTLEDVFAVQQDVAENIAAVLDVVLDDDTYKIMRGAGIRNVDAFIAYQKGLEAYAAAHDDFENVAAALASANAYFDQALSAAPSLTMARVWKADRATHNLYEIATRLREQEYPGEAEAALEALTEEYELALRLSPRGNQRDILDLESTLFSNDWSKLPGKIQNAMQPGKCPYINWIAKVIPPLGWAEQVAEKQREILACDPMDFLSNINYPLSLIWAGDSAAALQALEAAEEKGLGNASMDDVRFWAMLADGQTSGRSAPGPELKGSVARQAPPQILWEALAGDPATARLMAEEFWSRAEADNFSSLLVAAVVGDRELANEFAARIDAFPGSALVLSANIYACFCGAPFDLDATPNYKARIAEAGLSWPPPKRIDYPAKTW